MAERRSSHYAGEYVQGNTVRKARPVPAEREYREHRPVRNEQVRRAVRRNQEKALQIDLPYVVMLTIASICTLYLCVNYLHVQSSITARIHELAAQEKLLETMKSENDALATSINTYVDLDHVYQVATGDLGMVYANKNQVILYNKTESEYVRQYEDIPEH